MLSRLENPHQSWARFTKGKFHHSVASLFFFGRWIRREISSLLSSTQMRFFLKFVEVTMGHKSQKSNPTCHHLISLCLLSASGARVRKMEGKKIWFSSFSSIFTVYRLNILWFCCFLKHVIDAVDPRKSTRFFWLITSTNYYIVCLPNMNFRGIKEYDDDVEGRS